MTNEQKQTILAGKVPAGYKQTEVGIIPEDWEVMPLHYLVVSNGLVRGPFGGALKKEIFVKAGYKVYEQRNAIYSNWEMGDYYVTKSKFDELNRFAISAGDFVVSCSGTIGRIYQIPDDAPVGIINQALLKITINEKINAKYFLHYFRWDVFQNKIIDSTQGGAMKNLIGMSEFRNSLISLPSLKEQTAIAEALSDMDSLLVSLEKLIEKKRAIKTGTMQQLLTGKKRLPAFAQREDGTPKGYKMTELGEIPEDWEVITLSQLGSIYGGLTGKSKKDFGRGNASYIPFTNVMKNVVVDIANLDKVQVREKQNAVKKGDILFNGSSETPEELCFCSLLEHDIENLYLNSFCFGFRINNKHYYPKFLVYWFRSSQGREKIQEIAQGSTRYNISKSQFINLGVISLSLSEQKAITKVISDMDSEIEALENRLEKTKALKQGMMQELLTGRTRLV